MIMDNLKKEVVQIIKELSNNTSNKVKIAFAKFNCVVEEEYKKKMKIIDDDISGKIALYGKNEDECRKIKEELIKSYDDNFQKLYDKRKEQVLSIVMEITEMESNREVALANYISTLRTSGDKETKDNKLKALTDKFSNYTVALEQSFAEIDKVKDAVMDDFEVVISRVNNSVLDTSKSKGFMSGIMSFFNKYGNKGKFEKSISKKIESDILDIYNAEEEMMIDIYNQTLDIVSQIELARKSINEEYRKAVG